MPDESSRVVPPTPRVRRAELADAAALARLAEETFRDTYSADNAPDNVEVYVANHFGEGHQARELRDPAMATWLAVVERDGEEEPVGYVQLRFDAPCPVPVRETAVVEVARCYVHRDWHGLGVAHAMLSAAVADAAQRGARLAWLLVWQRNPRAVAFYRKFGFEVIGASVFHLGTDVQEDHVMALPLRG